jgi:hydroxymethylglutaryl-CoA lyase
MTRRIEIVEIGPRDGLRNEAVFLDVGQKVDFINRREARGVRRAEAGREAAPSALIHAGRFPRAVNLVE